MVGLSRHSSPSNSTVAFRLTVFKNPVKASSAWTERRPRIGAATCCRNHALNMTKGPFCNPPPTRILQCSGSLCFRFAANSGRQFALSFMGRYPIANCCPRNMKCRVKRGVSSIWWYIGFQDDLSRCHCSGVWSHSPREPPSEVPLF
jgi:hypothetical protein